jgi:putative transposase
VSNKKSARRSLGWIPFKKSGVNYADGYVQYGKQKFNLWDSYGIGKYSVKTGTFVEDSRGRWYVCLVVESPKQDKPTSTKAIGIDLGLKDIATCSDGTVISNPKFSRKYEQKLGIAQRAKIRNVFVHYTLRLQIVVKIICTKQAPCLLKTMHLLL